MTNQITSDQALEKLMAGNQRYVRGDPIHPNQTSDHRLALTEMQMPFAAVLGCADSRVPPNIVFDQGLGDLFIIRVAGNIVDNSVLGSLEYAVDQLHVPLVVVLGHSRCGAVAAAVGGDPLAGQLSTIARTIQPAVACAKYKRGDLIDNAIKANVQMVTTQVRNSEPILAPQVTSGQLKIIPAYYDLESGRVAILNDTKGGTNDEKR